MNDFETRKNAEEQRLLRICSDFSGARIEALQGLVEQAGYLHALAYDLRAELAKTGPVEVYTNGEHQSGRKPSAALSALLQTEKAYSGVLVKLAAQLPEPTKRREVDALALFKATMETDEGPSKAARLKAEIEAVASAAEDMGDAERDIAEQIARTRAAHPDVVGASPQELQERLQRS